MTWCAATLFLIFWIPVSLFAEVLEEQWASTAPNATEAFALYAPRRIGVLLVPFDAPPKASIRYWKDDEKRGSVGQPMPDGYELHLYDILRQTLQGQGYEVQCLNTGSWNGLRLDEVVAQARGVDAVYAVHYTVSHTYEVWERAGYAWWAPFKGMGLKVEGAVFDVRSGDFIYGLTAEILSTEALYTALGEIVAEEPLHPRGVDERGKRNLYKIAIYHTAIKDPKEGKRVIPMIRTGKGSLDISVARNPAEGGQMQFYNPQTMRAAQKMPEYRSVLDRVLDYVTYRPSSEEVLYFEQLTLAQCGEMLGKKIPKP
jgi:hypothetical protein